LFALKCCLVSSWIPTDRQGTKEELFYWEKKMRMKSWSYLEEGEKEELVHIRKRRGRRALPVFRRRRDRRRRRKASSTWEENVRKKIAGSCEKGAEKGLILLKRRR
jgi:hypothetical protein